MPERHKGYVVGRDNNPEGQSVWKVRVKDPDSPYNSQKLIVASVHGQLELAQGLNVNFAIGTVDDRSGQKVARAVDVRLEEGAGLAICPHCNRETVEESIVLCSKCGKPGCFFCLIRHIKEGSRTQWHLNCQSTGQQVRR